MCVTGQPILCESCCLSECIQITHREVLSPKLLLGIGASKTIRIAGVARADHRDHAEAAAADDADVLEVPQGELGVL